VVKPTLKAKAAWSKALRAASDQGVQQQEAITPSNMDNITLEDALRVDQKGWTKAIRQELLAIKDTGTYKVVNYKDLDDNTPVLSSRLVLKDKLDPAKHKARLVVRGFEQEHGINYTETFASVVRYTTLRALLSLAPTMGWDIQQLDVNTAFLNAELIEHDIYIHLPDFFELIADEGDISPDTHCLQLLKSLYGLKQAPRLWQQVIDSYIVDTLHMVKSNADPNYYYLYKDGKQAHLLLFVDDNLILGDKPLISTISYAISHKWKCDIEPSSSRFLFLGYHITKESDGSITIHQRRYINKVLNRFHMDQSNPIQLPVPAGTILDSSSESDLSDQEASLYRSITGSLLYLANGTRFDISYATGQLARHMANPLNSHLQLAKKVLRYIRGSINHQIHYISVPSPIQSSVLSNVQPSVLSNVQPSVLSTVQSPVPPIYQSYSDATWATEPDRVSTQGWVVVWNGGAISWHSGRQRSTALSSMEAELIAANELAKEVVWFGKLALDLRLYTDGNTIPILRLDNQGTIDLIHRPREHAKSKHIQTRAFYIRNDLVRQKKLLLQHIPGKENPADILTKQLPYEPFTTHLRTLGLY